MKNLIAFITLAFYAAIIAGCVKNNDYTPGTDHTAGIVTSKKWSGTTNGNFKWDSTRIDDVTHNTVHKDWPRHYSRTITDSTFALEKINDFTIKALSHWMRYRSTDSTLKVVKYDTTYGSAARSFVTFNYSTGHIDMEIHRLYDFNSEASLFYEDHWYLHTVE
jgi:hypothetical protein